MSEIHTRRPRRRFTDDFKQQAVRLVFDEGKSMTAVARELDLTPSGLALWVKHAQADRTKGRTELTSAEREELTRLRRDNRILQEEREILESGGLLREAPAMRFRVIASEKAHYALPTLCRVLQVSRSGFYAWQHRPRSPRAQRDVQLRVRIRAFHASSHGRYGSLRIWKDWVEAGEAISRQRVIRLMQADGLRGKVARRDRPTTDGAHTDPVAANHLARRFDARGQTSAGSATPRRFRLPMGTPSTWPRSSTSTRASSSGGRSVP